MKRDLPTKFHVSLDMRQHTFTISIKSQKDPQQQTTPRSTTPSSMLHPTLAPQIVASVSPSSSSCHLSNALDTEESFTTSSSKMLEQILVSRKLVSRIQALRSRTYAIDEI